MKKGSFSSWGSFCIIPSIFLLLIICTEISAQNKMQMIKGFDNIAVSQKSMSDANAAFQIIKGAPIHLTNKTEMANNCENRAEFAFSVLTKLGFKPVNFWIFKEGLVETTYTTAKAVKKSNGLAFNTHLGSKPYVFWGYHVASGIILDNNGQNDTLIFDPWTQGGFVTLKQWALSFFQEPTGRTVYAFPVTGLYRFYGTTGIGQLSKEKADWTNTDNDLNQMYCGLCGITPNAKCDNPRHQAEIKDKRTEIIKYLKDKGIDFN